MKTNEIKNHILNGTLEQAIKQNNRQWFLIVSLFIIVFGGYSVILTKRNLTLQEQMKPLQDSLSYKDAVIGIQSQALDSAVYFYEIKDRFK